MVKVHVSEYKGWKNCVFITNGTIEAVVTTDVGPRIMRYGFIGKENIMHEDKSLLGKSGASEWVNYGGHRLWHSPELLSRTYVPDNSAVEFNMLIDGVETIQHEHSINIDKKMVITMNANGEMTIKHTIINTGMWEIELAAWSLSVLAPGGLEVIPILRGDENALLGDRTITLWPYTIMADERVYWGNDCITVKQSDKATRKFKFGIQNKCGMAAYFIHNQLFIKSHEHNDDEYYPDDNCSFETFTNSDMLEMETLSPLSLLAQGEEIKHIEHWSLFNNVECPDRHNEKALLAKVKECTSVL